VTSIDWNTESFDNLAIDSDRKHLILGLVKSHANLKEDRSADDFVTGKGVGLIICLFGTLHCLFREIELNIRQDLLALVKL
jgi:hypothetical protein